MNRPFVFLLALSLFLIPIGKQYAQEGIIDLSDDEVFRNFSVSNRLRAEYDDNLRLDQDDDDSKLLLSGLQELDVYHADNIFEKAEEYEPGIFASEAKTRLIIYQGIKYAYRYWAETGVFAAVDLASKILYLLGGPFGDTPQSMGTLQFISRTYELPDTFDRSSDVCIPTPVASEGDSVTHIITDGESGVTYEQTTLIESVSDDKIARLITQQFELADGSAVENIFRESNDFVYNALVSAESYLINARYLTGTTTEVEQYYNGVLTQQYTDTAIYDSPLLAEPADEYCLNDSWSRGPRLLTINRTYKEPPGQPDEEFTIETDATITRLNQIDKVVSIDGYEIRTLETIEINQNGFNLNNISYQDSEPVVVPLGMTALSAGVSFSQYESQPILGEIRAGYPGRHYENESDLRDDFSRHRVGLGWVLKL